MRDLVGFVCVMALVALPRSASAQVEAVISEPSVEEAAPTSETAAQEPALKLEIDEAGVQLDSSPPRRTPDGYTLEEMKLRVKRARIGLLSTTGVLLGGLAVYIGTANRSYSGPGPDPLAVTGASLLVSGSLGMLATGILLGVRNRQMDELRPRGERIRRARIGLLSTTGVFVASGLLWMWFVLADCGILGGDCAGLGGAAAVMSIGGGTGMLVTGILLGVRKRKQGRLAQTQYRAPRRVQWDLARSRLVF